MKEINLLDNGKTRGFNGELAFNYRIGRIHSPYQNVPFRLLVILINKSRSRHENDTF